MGSFNFQPHILQPTRITDHSQTLIDNIFFNSLDHLTLSGNVIYDLTDHLPNFLIIKKFTSLPNKVRFYKKGYSNFDESALIQDIHSAQHEILNLRFRKDAVKKALRSSLRIFTSFFRHS